MLEHYCGNKKVFKNCLVDLKGQDRKLMNIMNKRTETKPTDFTNLINSPI